MTEMILELVRPIVVPLADGLLICSVLNWIFKRGAFRDASS